MRRYMPGAVAAHIRDTGGYCAVQKRRKIWVE
jgi:hypothetical protein